MVHLHTRTDPCQVLSVLTLETLDLRNNRIEYLPEDLAKLQNLKTLSIFHNNVKKFPLCIGQMHTLSYIQSRKNPIEFPPPSQWRTSIRTPDNEVEDRERDIAETDRLKRILRDFAKTQRSKNDSADDTRYEDMVVPEVSKLTRTQRGFCRDTQALEKKDGGQVSNQAKCQWS